MRVRSLLAVGALSVAGLIMSAPSAIAAPAHQVSAPKQVTAVDAAARPVCVSAATHRAFATTCRKAAPGRQFRAGINCTNSGWRNGPWRRQTHNFSTISAVRCPAGGRAQRVRIQFR